MMRVPRSPWFGVFAGALLLAAALTAALAVGQTGDDGPRDPLVIRCEAGPEMTAARHSSPICLKHPIGLSVPYPLTDPRTPLLPP